MMVAGKLFYLGLVAALAVGASADEVLKAQDEHQNNVIPQSTAGTAVQPQLPNDLIPTNVMSMLTNGGVVAAVMVSIGLLVMLIAPTFGIRVCSILGNCPTDATQYSGYSNAGYGDYQGYQQGTYNSPAYQRRSLEYVGPILKALGNAYDKYSRTSQIKSA